jgi:hypothetical protein
MQPASHLFKSLIEEVEDFLKIALLLQNLITKLSPKILLR